MERVVAPELRWYEINTDDPEPLFACSAGADAPPPNGAEKLPLLGYSSHDNVIALELRRPLLRCLLRGR